MMSESKPQKDPVTSFIDPDKVAKDVTFTEVDLNDAMINQAGHSAFYGNVMARAQQQVGLLKVRSKTIEARVYKELREEAAEEKKKVTEAQLKMEVAADTRMVTAEANLVNATYQLDICKSAFEAFKQRRDMLVQISKGKLEELKGNVSAGMTQSTAGELSEAELRKQALKIIEGE